MKGSARRSALFAALAFLAMLLVNEVVIAYYESAAGKQGENQTDNLTLNQTDDQGVGLTGGHIGLILHFGLFVALVTWGLTTGYRYPEIRVLALSLTLVQMVRIANLSIPSIYLPGLFQFAAIYTVVLAVCASLVSAEPRMMEGTVLRAPGRYDLALLGLAVLMGFVEYHILGARHVGIVADYGLPSLVGISIVMLAFVGLGEEVTFRAFLQPPSQAVLGRWAGLGYTSLVFALMHLVWRNPLDVVFAFSAGLIFGYVFDRTRNLTSIVLMHGVINIVLFYFMPIIAPPPSLP